MARLAILGINELHGYIFFLQKKQTQPQPVLGMARKQLLGLVVTVKDIVIDKVIVTVFN